MRDPETCLGSQHIDLRRHRNALLLDAGAVEVQLERQALQAVLVARPGPLNFCQARLEAEEEVLEEVALLFDILEGERNVAL
jgi:hypothetical protein